MDCNEQEGRAERYTERGLAAVQECRIDQRDQLAQQGR